MCDISKLNILYWNADGVRNKLQQLSDLVSGDKLTTDIIAVSETKINSNVPLQIHGYTCYRQDRHASGRGQGVALFIKSDIHHHSIKMPRTVNIEAVGVNVEVGNVHYTFISTYQSPNIPLLARDIDTLFSLGSRVLLIGDLNAKHHQWSPGKANKHGGTLFDLMLKRDFVIHAPSQPTLVHYHTNYEQSTPDIALALNIPYITNVQTHVALSSNHLPVTLSIEANVTRTPRCIHMYNKADWIKYRSFLNDNTHLASKIFSSIDEINHEINNLTSNIIAAREIAIPKSSPNGPKQLPKFIKKLISSKNQLRRCLLREKNHQNRLYLRFQINTLQDRIKLCIKKYNDKSWEDKLRKVDNPKADLWRVVKSLSNKPVVIPALTKSDGSTTCNSLEQCNALAEAFEANMRLTLDWTTENAVHLAISDSISALDNHTISKNINLTSPHEIWSSLRKLKCRKAPGVDNIQNVLLKNLPQRCIVLLAKLFNACLLQGYFPNQWKEAKIIPLKKPNKDDKLPSSYRPISLLPTLGKLFERIIHKRLLHHLGDSLIVEQFGFRRCHSTVQQLARVSEKVAVSLNCEQSTGMFLLDIEKAFDSVWHHGLLHKLITIGIPLDIVKIIQAYLQNREFKVHINSYCSDSFHIPAGVPQGSILGPTLFLAYINDIPKQPHTHLACFADDTASLASSNDIDLIIGRLQLSLDLLKTFFTTWKLKLNSSKTEAILFTRHRKLPERKLIIDGFKIPWSATVKYLGVILDSKINWTPHVNSLRIKGARAFNALSPVLNRRSTLSPYTKLKIYSTLIRPCITYACPVWSSTCQSNYNKLQVIQNKALKTAFDTPFYTNLHNLHAIIGFPKLKDFILNITKRFYLFKNNEHSNALICNIGQSRYNSRQTINNIRYKLPHHYVLQKTYDVDASRVIADT